MADNKILYVTQEIAPYIAGGTLSNFGKELPQSVQSKKYEVRTFMPRFGTINERRNQLHEVIRLSGHNIVINDSDHPLIIKVASMQTSRIQVYFIDNDDYFQKLESDVDPSGTNRPDNDERAIFFSRGTTETAKKLRWEPSVIHCSGWITALSPMYFKRMYADDSAFKGSKIIYSVLPQTLPESIDQAIYNKLKADGLSAKDLKKIKSFPHDHNLLHKIAIAYSDGVIFHTDTPDPEILAFVEEEGIPYTTLPIENPDSEAYLAFYESISSKDKKK